MRKIKIHQGLVFPLVLSALLLQACGANAQSAISTGIAQTQQISELQTEAAGGFDASQQDQAGDSEVAAVEVTTVRDLNMRAGDSTAYSVMTVIPANEKVLVTGVDEDGSWYQIEYHGAVGWISAIYTEGDVPADMPKVTPPALANNSGGNDNGGGGNDNGGGGNDNGGDEFDWSGNWDMNYDGDVAENVHITQSGDSINGSIDFGSYTVTFSGTLSPNHHEAAGTWNSSTIGHSDSHFEWAINSNMDQFVGRAVFQGSSFPWCGWRSGSSAPSPCLLP